FVLLGTGLLKIVVIVRVAAKSHELACARRLCDVNYSQEISGT
ncbi:33760_t:CDS:2, partial [Racocetra persica]